MSTSHPALTASRDGAVVAATVLIIRDSNTGPEVLLLQRHPDARNMGGAWMFPGGKVDPDDEGDSELTRARTAAVREIEEEASIAVDPASLVDFSHWLTPVCGEASIRYLVLFGATARGRNGDGRRV